MDPDQQNKLGDGLYQGEGSVRVENSMEEMGKMKSSAYEVGDEAKGDDGGKGKKPAALGMRKCDFCGKEFSSGKALGGHKSFHLRKELREAKEAITYGKKMADGRLGCHLCNRIFRSRNSLFGHMRAHTDRLWRGVNPPELCDKQGSSSSFNPVGSMKENNDFGAVVAPNEPVTDLKKSLPPGWLQTYKRGRECLSCKKITEAAIKLMSLSQGYIWSCDEWENQVNLAG